MAPFVSMEPGALAKMPTKPLLRRSTLSGTRRKADEAGLDSDPIVPSNPTKRARVSFNPTVEEKVVEEYTVKGRSLETIRVEVKRAIESHLKGDSERYDTIKELFAPNGDISDGEDGSAAKGELKTYLIALTSYVSLLNKGCAGLVKAILACEWMGRDEGYVKAYVTFLGNFASAQGAYVGMVLGMLVGHFAGIRFSSGRLPGCPDVSRDQLSSRIHVAMKYLLRLIPSASATLSPILSTKFPFSDDSKKDHITYINNLITLTEYAPELKSDIFALITDRLVKIDVQMITDLDDLDDEVAGAIVQILSLDAAGEEDDEHGEESGSDVDSVTSDDFDIDSKRSKQILGNVEKMDAIIDILFTTYSPSFSDPHCPEAAEMLDTLLSHFINIILPTYRSRHTQFLLFHFAQKAEYLVEQFIGTCVQLAFQPGRPAVLCQSSIAYLASFVARGAHVPPHIVREVFDVLGQNLDRIRTSNELTCRGPDLRRYGTFYAMTQALLYIFCFRWRDLITLPEMLDDEDDSFLSQDIEWIPGIKDVLHRNIYSKLNPLKICSPPIVSEFAKIAHHLNFLYIYPLLETNKRIRLSQFTSGNGDGALRDTGNGGNNESWHQLESYFPFDPYQLPNSKKWIEGDYIQWRGIPGLKQDEDDEDESEDDDEEDEEGEEIDDATDDDADD